MIAEVVVNRSAKKLNRTFDYKIPEKWEDYIVVGSKVWVPFANFKELEQAYVVKIKETTSFKVKEIARIEDSLTEKQMELAKWIAKQYFCNLSDAIKLFLPPGTSRNNNKIQDKKIQCIYLVKEIEDIKFAIEEKLISSEKQKIALSYIMENEGCSIIDMEERTNCSRAIVKTLEKNGYVEIIERKLERNPLENKDIEKTEKLVLTEEQSKAYQKVEKAMDINQFEEFLLYGVTGSGKTEIYLQLIEKAIKEAKNAIVLVPEISLTPQMLERFIARFGKETIAVLHSKLSLGERYDEWNKIKEGKAQIIIGARSAIFAPIKDIGIIIIDEEHDSSYKSEMAPKYQAKEVAEKIAIQNKCPLVLGSATPAISSFYKAKNGKITLLELTKRANKSTLPKVEIVDLKQELAKGNRSMISTDLFSAIEENIQRKRQTILFLNRRGFSTFIMCRDCGYTVKCKDCDISMTYHRKENKLKCHYCGREEKLVSICPECQSSKIRYFGTGTQKLEEEIHKLFPQAKTIRMDIDTVTKKNSHEEILKTFKEEEIDILIGTQMVVKGHHFPKVTLVGVIAADTSLNMDDYQANEKTFQILTQVAGRAGREKEAGKVFVQTYNPDSFSIQSAKKQNYDEFYETEIALRNQLNYPPFCDIILVNFNGLKQEELKDISQEFYQRIKQKVNEEELKIFNPAPSPIDKIQGRYRWRIIIKGKMTDDMNKKLTQILKEIYELNMKQVRVSIDVNPNSMI